MRQMKRYKLQQKEFTTNYEIVADVDDLNTLNLYMQDIERLKFVVEVDRVNK